MASKSQWLVFIADQHAFACPMEEVVEIVQSNALKQNQEAPEDILGWVEVDNQHVPVLNLVTHLYQKPSHFACQEIVVLSTKDKLIGLAVEHILAVSKPGDEKELEHCIPMDKFCLMNKITYLKDEHLRLNLQ